MNHKRRDTRQFAPFKWVSFCRCGWSSAYMQTEAAANRSWIAHSQGETSDGSNRHE